MMGECNKRASWNLVGQRSREGIEQYIVGGTEEDMLSIEKTGGYKA